MDGLALSVERPVILSADARAKLEVARKRLRLEQQTGRDDDDSEEERDEILERAHEDASNTAR
jgi:hypothetical protein